MNTNYIRIRVGTHVANILSEFDANHYMLDLRQSEKLTKFANICRNIRQKIFATTLLSIKLGTHAANICRNFRQIFANK